MSQSHAESSQSIHVLYVNGDSDFADLARTKLQNRSGVFEVTVVETADAAFEALATAAIDCVVTSYSLPDGTGLDLLDRLRSEQHDVPTILFTGRGSEQIASEATQAGVSDYIPIHPEQNSFQLLAQRIQTLVDAARNEAFADRMSERFQRTLERATDAIYAVDRDWRIEFMNEKMADRVDRSPESVVGTTLWETFPSIVGTELEERYRTAMETGETMAFEQRLGPPFDYWVEVRVFPDDDGITIFSREITAERERELELERSETILQNIRDIVFVLDNEGKVEFANRAAERLTVGEASAPIEGQSLETVVGDAVADSDRERLMGAVESTLEGAADADDYSGLYEADLQLDLKAGGSEGTFDVRLTPFQYSESQQVLVVARDVSEQDEVKRQLERERDALRGLQTAMAASDISAETRLQQLLEVGCRTLGLEVGIVSHIQDSKYAVRAVHAPNAEIESGDRFDLASTYCEDVVESDGIHSFADAAAEGKATHPAYRDLGLASYIGTPLVVDGERYGTVNFSSPTTRAAPFGELERTFIELLAELASAEISRERDRAELERQDFLFERVQDIAEIGVWEFFPSSGELHWSSGTCQIHGVDDGYEPSLEEAIEFYHPDDRETVSAAVERAIESGDPYDLDLRLVRNDGEVREVRAWGERVESPLQGGPVLRGVFQDLTERKSQQREYQELAEEYEALLDSSGDAIFLLDVDSTGEGSTFEFARLSPGYEDQTGLTTESVRGQTPREIFGDERGAELEANYQHCVEKREPISYREELDVGPDARFWDTSLAPVIVDDEIVRLVGIARNITEQVDRERELEATNQRLESLIEAVPLTIMEIDRDGNVVLWNQGAEEMFGWSRDEVIDEFNPIVPDDQRIEFDTHRERALGGDPIRGKEVQRVTKDGEQLDLLLSVAPLTDTDGTVTSVLAVLEDITEQKQLEANLRALQETAQDLSRGVSTGEIGTVAVTAAEEILGFEIAGIWEYSEQQEALIPVAETEAGRELFGESPRFTPGESLAWNAFESGEPLLYDDIRSEEAVYNPDTDLRSELLVPLGEYGLLVASSQAKQDFSDTDADLFRILGATVEAALARVTRERRLQRQNERLDQFASVVAHDLRNPLTVATGFLELAEETGDSEAFAKVESAHSRMQQLIGDLLTLARGETTIEDPEQIGLDTVATEAWGYVDTDEATLTVEDSVPTVAGDEGRLTQLFENLFRNAIEHGGDDVTVTVGQLGSAPGFYVEDDGDGIPTEKRDTVFDHGVTYSNGGTGFGLSIVADIAKAHGWTASVTAGADGGARFEFEATQ